MKKILFLVFTLAIPASIFIFLKYFGTNTFEVPILFEQGIPGCDNDKQPHIVPNIEYLGKGDKSFQFHDLEGFIVYGFLDASNPDQYNKTIVDLIQVQDSFYEKKIPYFLLFVLGNRHERDTMEALLEERGMDKGYFNIAYLAKEELIDFLRCGMGFVDAPTDAFVNLVMSDPKGRIRGVYNSLDQAGTDQLILELQILKQKK